MFCEKCGTPLENDAAFCEKCGTPVAKDTTVRVTKKTAGFKLTKKMTIIALSIVAALAILIGIIAIVPGKSINLNDYVTVKFEGVNTIGKAYADFDDEAFEAKLTEVYPDLMSDLKFVQEYMFTDVFEYELDKESELSNGDKVVVKFMVDKEFLIKYNLNFKYNPVEFTVEGLKEIQEIDVFSFAEVSFSGASPHATGKATNKSTDTFLKEIDFFLNGSYNLQHLKNGETVTLSASCDIKKAFENGYKFIGVTATEGYISLKKEITVKTTEEYVSTSDSLTKANSSDMIVAADKLAKEIFISTNKNINIAKSWLDTYYLYKAENVTEPIPSRMFLMTHSSPENYSAGLNYVYFTYNLSAKNINGKDFDNAVAYVRVDDIIIDSNGTISFKEDSVKYSSTCYVSYEAFNNAVLDKSSYKSTEIFIR